MKAYLANRTREKWLFISIVLVGHLAHPLATLYSQTCTPPPSGLVGWWRGEGDTQDEFAEAIGTLTGNASFTPGRVGLAFSFDGAGDAVALTNSEPFKLQTFTIEGWIRRRDAGKASLTLGAGLFFSFGSGGYGFGLLDDGSLVLSRLDFWDVRTPVSVVTNTNWHHVAVVSATNTETFYVDGVARASLSYVGTFTFTTPAVVGARPENFDNSFLGEVDELSVYNRALAPSEIQSIFNAGTAGKCVPPATPSINVQPTNQRVIAGDGTMFDAVAGGAKPLSYQWQFYGTNLVGETNSTLILANVQPAQAGEYTLMVSNTFGSTNSAPAVLTVNPAPPCVTAPSGLVGWWRGEGDTQDEFSEATGTLVGNASFTPDQLGLAFRFDGAGDAVALTNSEPFKLQTFTIESWIRRGDASRASLTPAAGLFFSFGSGGYGFGLLDDGSLFVSRLDFWDVRTPVSVVTDTNWHHVAVVSATNTETFYVDGVARASLSYVGTFTFTTPAVVGARPENFANSFLGEVDELSVYNRALTPSEIQTVYTAVSTRRCSLPLRIITAPQNQAAAVGTNVTFSVQALGEGTLAYQWFLDATNIIAGATNTSLTLTNVQFDQAGQYSVTVTDNVAALTSPAVTLTVYIPPVILAQPISQVVIAGDPVQFTVSATNGSLTYQWRRNGININGATAPTLVIGQAQSSSAGSYTVRVSNPYASITSQPAVLTVSVAKITSGSLGTNGFTLSVHSQPNLNFAVEVSTNLSSNPVSWQTLATILTVPANWDYTDSTGSASAARFYRLRRVP